MLFKKCTGCKREFTKEEIEDIKSKEKASKEKLQKNACPECRKPLKTYDKRMIDHLVLVEFKYYDDDSFEVKVPLLNLAFETKDFSEAINIPDENISIYLKDKYKKAYDVGQKILTQAFIKETISEKQNVTAWW
jgi:DNA-directed RNA polymerase subunit RPC12/RpoP